MLSLTNPNFKGSKGTKRGGVHQEGHQIESRPLPEVIHDGEELKGQPILPEVVALLEHDHDVVLEREPNETSVLK